MLLSRQLPLSALIECCRALRHNLGAGLTLRDVWRQQARRGPAPLRPIADRVQEQIEGGYSLASALDRERGHFPSIFLAMTEVGEETGNLPEVFAELEKFFLLQQKLRRQFIGQIAWPAFQFIAATLVVAGLIFLLGLISNPSVPDDWKFAPLGKWFMGPNGALLFLGLVYGGIGAVFAAYLGSARLLHQQAAADRLLLKVPALGGCLRAVAMTRFCLALRLTMETGMSLRKALRLCFRATGNEAYLARADVACEAIQSGEDLTEALAATGLFPRDFLDIMANAEEGGRVAEAMSHQADYYEEEASRRMTILTRVAGFGVWLLVAAFIIFMIFRIVLYYIGMLDPAKYGL